MEKLYKGGLDFSAAGIIATYIALKEAIPDMDMPAWAILGGALLATIGRGLWLAYKDDKKISPDEVAALFGHTSQELSEALEYAKQSGVLKDKAAPEIEKESE